MNTHQELTVDHHKLAFLKLNEQTEGAPIVLINGQKLDMQAMRYFFREFPDVDITPLLGQIQAPALVITGIHAAVPIWNDFFFPLVFIQSDDFKTLPQGLSVFMGEFHTDWGVLFAGLALASLPITILYVALSRQFIAGLTQGAVK